MSVTVICRDCGHANEADDQFCGSCGSFLEFTGDRIEPPKAEELPEHEDPEYLRRAKQALSVDKASLTQSEAVEAKVLSDDEALAQKVVADREREEAAERQRVIDEENAKQVAEREAERKEAERARVAAEQELEAVRQQQARDAEAAKAAAEKAQVEAEERMARQIAEAQERARAEAAEAQRQAEERLAAEREQAERDRQRAAAEASAAQAAEEEAERARVEAQQRLEQAAAAAAAAALRAVEERDALAAADAARLASEAEAEQARASAQAAKAEAAHDVAKARAEAEAAKAEAAELRAKAQQEAALSELDRQRREAETKANQEADNARRLAEDQARAERERLEEDRKAELARQALDAEAAERKAESDLAARRAEEKAAAARAEAERARVEADVQERKREREEALRRAAALVASPASSIASAPTKVGATKPAAKTPGAPQGKSDSAGSTPGAQLPGAAQVRKAPKGSEIAEINPGDLICGQCRVGNVPTRKFCRRCGTSLSEAKPAKLGLIARFRAWRRRRKQKNAGARPGRGAPGEKGSLGRKGRAASWTLKAKLSRLTAILALFAAFGFGVEPIRQKLHLPNVRATVMTKIRSWVTNPPYDPVRPLEAFGSSNLPGSLSSSLIDLGNNTTWLAKPKVTDGVGQAVEVNFAKPFNLGRVLVTSGLAGEDGVGKGFTSQPRPSEFRVIYNKDFANPEVVKLKDTAEPQVLTLKHKDVTVIRFEITGVYPAAGKKGHSVAITEMEFFQRRLPGDDYETLPTPKVSVSPAAGAASMVDDDMTTAWTSSPIDDGVGTIITLTFALPTDVDRLRIAPSNDEATFQSTPRPKELQIAITCDGRCDATKQASLKDKPGFKNVGIGATGVRKLEILVRSVHGTGGGVRIAEIQVQRKRPKAQ